MKFSAKMIGQAAVIVMETQVSRAHLAHPELLLLEAGCRHGVSVFFLRRERNKTDLMVRSSMEEERRRAPLHCKFSQNAPCSPQHPSSSCGPSPPLAAPSGLHQHCPQPRAVQPWPEASRFPRSAHEPFLPETETNKI